MHALPIAPRSGQLDPPAALNLSTVIARVCNTSEPPEPDPGPQIPFYTLSPPPVAHTFLYCPGSLLVILSQLRMYSLDALWLLQTRCLDSFALHTAH